MGFGFILLCNESISSLAWRKWQWAGK